MSETQHAATFEAPDIEEVSLLFHAYDVHALIACGGMGAVYQVTQRSLDRVAAIKILPREFSTDKEFRKGFESEAKAMAKLNHPNLIGVYDFGEADGMLYIIMEYVDGKSLYHSAHGQVVDPSEALRIVSQVCSGLDHAHTYGILHRDIKPSNILLDSKINPKIGDFGLARALESKIEEGEQIYGTPGYTAPEVLQPPYSFDQRADVFSVGVMLCELLTGKLPEADPRPVSQLCKCNPRLDAVIRKAMNPNPELRYSTASELATELDKISSGSTNALLTGADLPRKPSARKMPAPALKMPAPARKMPAPARKMYAPPKYNKFKDSSSSGLVIVVIFLAIAVAVAFFVLKKDKPVPVKTEATEEVQPKVAQNDDPKGKPAPVAKPREKAKFDVSALLQNSRGTMAGRVRPFIEKANSRIQGNTRGFERGLGVLIQKNTGDLRMLAEDSLDQATKQWDAGGHRIPETLPFDLQKIDGAPALHQEHYAKQTEILETAAARVKAQSGIYVLKLENQIEQSRKDGDEDAIDGIQAEINRVKGEDGYFRSLFVN